MSVFRLYLVCFMLTLVLMCIVFLVARKIKRFDLVDAAWGWAFIVPAMASYLLNLSNTFDFNVQTVTTTIVLIWGIRLSRHILRRIKHSKTEDERYVDLRKKWKGNIELHIFLRIYLLQALLAFIICLPVMHINFFAVITWSWVMSAGLIVWIIGFLFEAVSDRQLRDFIANPDNKGKIMTEGFWKYSRHPNYFGELTQWWGIFIICLSVSFGWVTIVGPLLITYLIVCVSGIPLNEKRFEGRPGWNVYKMRTSALIPFMKLKRKSE